MKYLVAIALLAALMLQGEVREVAADKSDKKQGYEGWHKEEHEGKE